MRPVSGDCAVVGSSVSYSPREGSCEVPITLGCVLHRQVVGRIWQDRAHAYHANGSTLEMCFAKPRGN